MELRAVRGVELVTAVGRARRDHANGGRRSLHRADLNSGRMCAEQSAVGQKKCVLLVARGMFRRSVQRIKAVPFGFNVGSICESETHPPENFDRPFQHLRERMQASALTCRSWK